MEHEIDLKHVHLACMSLMPLPGQELFQFVDEKVRSATSVPKASMNTFAKSAIATVREETERELREELKSLPPEEAAVLALLRKGIQRELREQDRPEDISDEQFDKTFKTNVYGYF